MGPESQTASFASFRGVHLNESLLHCERPIYETMNMS